MNNINKYRFSDLYDISSGISSSKEQAGHGAPFVSFSTVFNNIFLPDELPDKMDTSISEQEACSIKEGDILLTRTSETIDELAMSCVAAKDYPNATFSGFVKRLRPKTDGIAYHKYLAFYLRGYLFRQSVTNNAFMTLRASFNEDIFSYLYLYLPPFKQQVLIGDLFYRIEQKIRLNSRICAELEAMAKTLYDYWFVQFDFPDENGKPYHTSGGTMEWCQELGREVPKGWKTTTIGDITICHDSERIPLSDNQRQEIFGEIPYYGATGMMGSVNRAIFDGDYVLMAEDGSVMDQQGHPILQRIHHPCWINNHAHVLEPKAEYSCMLLYMLLKDIPVVKIKTGSIQMKINQANMNAYHIIDIPAQLRLKANEFLSHVDKQIDEIKNENQELSKFRDWLLPMLMNGQARIEP